MTMSGARQQHEPFDAFTTDINDDTPLIRQLRSKLRAKTVQRDRLITTLRNEWQGGASHVEIERVLKMLGSRI